MKKLNKKPLTMLFCASVFLAGCMEEGRMDPQEEDVDVVDPGLGEDENEDGENESN
ncbi:hypothetical protein [Bacillus sp. SG-1]|uniref:hypothetical protein n=1 Tax=Bacillus sp. SG-1 TaxID=161544 RepID=UPI0001543678|nr:hypothetical protein [Bacillus sp. SG-1]EDL65828.1 hypothetical protein BSG1_16270 [Bacillus sp. SG-1]